MSVSVEAPVAGRPAVSTTGRPRRPRAKVLAAVSRWMFIAPAALYVAVFFGHPVVKNIVMSFQDYSTRTLFTGKAPWVVLGNCGATFRSSLFTATVVNAALFGVGSIGAQFVIGLALALFFRRN